ncbi:MAG: zinc-dependent alcohol dehydrogenase family protein [Xanthomonadales bacterium]|nr:zinc-dependent alcohol dehydrogenase family protein [Gammaproteobacteria bacterium]MBT8055007.1 zinc-dependent alcohol dehydrogenase family protein [Gammaproteobacteria bacterium]NND56389.1 zinc-dependent alcohol dehydrogenase family protein [Xanthomonadales bacterium]NNK50446.1 zinc-dependent alcohol dehydrogenase family protein [Xanthomonadales bacterium]
MRAMRIHRLGSVSPGSRPLEADRVPIPVPGDSDLLIRVRACGVCHTELDEIEGRTPPPKLPMIPGHQVIGTVEDQGAACRLGLLGQRVGVAWIHSACGKCSWCLSGRENLCPDFIACGRDAPGGYAEFMVVPEAFAYPIPDQLGDLEATPLLCAGAVGYRALSLCRLENGQKLGLTGFGASGHLVLQMARHLYPDSPVFVFARSEKERDFAMTLGASWAGDTIDKPVTGLDAIIDTTPAWLPVLSAMEALLPGGHLVINAIQKESGDQNLMATLDYDRHLWREKSLSTVANVTRRDVSECLRLASEIPLQPRVTAYGLEEANQALLELKQGHIRGAKALSVTAGNP